MNTVTSLPINWLDPLPNGVYVGDHTTTAQTDTHNGTTTTDTVWLNGGNVYPWYPQTTDRIVYYSDYSWWTKVEKIRLKMSEVEKLREAAKKDKELKKVLAKIGPHIEVEVDFG